MIEKIYELKFYQKKLTSMTNIETLSKSTLGRRGISKILTPSSMKKAKKLSLHQKIYSTYLFFMHRTWQDCSEIGQMAVLLGKLPIHEQF